MRNIWAENIRIGAIDRQAFYRKHNLDRTNYCDFSAAPLAEDMVLHIPAALHQKREIRREQPFPDTMQTAALQVSVRNESMSNTNPRYADLERATAISGLATRGRFSCLSPDIPLSPNIPRKVIYRDFQSVGGVAAVEVTFQGFLFIQSLTNIPEKRSVFSLQKVQRKHRPLQRVASA